MCVCVCVCVLVYATLWGPYAPTRIVKPEMFWHCGDLPAVPARGKIIKNSKWCLSESVTMQTGLHTHTHTHTHIWFCELWRYQNVWSDYPKVILMNLFLVWVSPCNQFVDKILLTPHTCRTSDRCLLRLRTRRLHWDVRQMCFLPGRSTQM